MTPRLPHIAQSACFFVLTLMVNAETAVRERSEEVDRPDMKSLSAGLVGLEVYPKSVSLETAADFHRMVVIGKYEDERPSMSPVRPFFLSSILPLPASRKTC